MPSDEDVQRQNIAFMLEHPQVWAAFEEIADEYDHQIGFHVITADTVAWAKTEGLDLPFEALDTVVRTLPHETSVPVAVIKPDGTVHRLDKEE